ncbi:MAG: P83/100 family protein, partial [Alkalispirochaetaceae bacterium]
MHYSKTMIARLLLVVLFVTALPAFSQEVDVDREELESQAEATIEFENFEGEQEEVSSADEIRGIGEALSEGLAPEPGATADYFGRYTIFRGVDPEDPEGLDADVLSINPDAEVNHIDNVRRIIAGYLIDAFDYSREDADLVAELTTIYNAVHRGNFTFFSGRYKAIVTDYLDPERVGIATSYTQWPGSTQLVIPLSAGGAPGDLDAVSPLQLADPAVIEDLRRRRDMGIETRKAMIRLIERVIEEREEAIEEEREEIEEEREQIEEEREQIAGEEPEEEAPEEAEPEEEEPEEEAPDEEPEDEEPEDEGHEAEGPEDEGPEDEEHEDEEPEAEGPEEAEPEAEQPEEAEPEEAEPEE